MKQLGLAWYADLDTNRGQEATPLVVDGVMYVSTAWSMVKAFDAKTRPEDLFRLPILEFTSWAAVKLVCMMVNDPRASGRDSGRRAGRSRS